MWGLAATRPVRVWKKTSFTRGEEEVESIEVDFGRPRVCQACLLELYACWQRFSRVNDLRRPAKIRPADRHYTHGTHRSRPYFQSKSWTPMPRSTLIRCLRLDTKLLLPPPRAGPNRQPPPLAPLPRLLNHQCAFNRTYQSAFDRTQKSPFESYTTEWQNLLAAWKPMTVH